MLTPFSHAAIYDTRYSLPSRIAGTLDIKAKLTDTLAELGATYAVSIWDQNTYDHRLTKAILPLARTVIYCGLCVCLIHTAVLICQRESSLIHEYVVRPDDRLMSSCCPEQDRIAGLRSIYNQVKYYEAKAKASFNHGVPESIRYVDMWWLEERLHRLEYEDEYVEFQGQLSQEDVSRVVIIGEPAFLRPITRNMSGSRVPRETEIWQFQIPSDGDGPWKPRFFGTFTPRHPNITD
jgi:hypothetical protein